QGPRDDCGSISCQGRTRRGARRTCGRKSHSAKGPGSLAYAQISAPFDGVVTELDAYTGSLLPAGTSTSQNGLALCHLSQNNLLRLVIPVPETVVPQVRVGEAVQVR